MTSRLRDDRDLLAEALDRLEGLTGIPFRQLEKDFWLTEALRGVANAAAAEGLPIFFKGGTSLSKVFGIIERFSEDVDVLVALPKTDALMSANQRAKALERLAAGAIDATGLPATTDPNKTRKARAGPCSSPTRTTWRAPRSRRCAPRECWSSLAVGAGPSLTRHAR